MFCQRLIGSYKVCGHFSIFVSINFTFSFGLVSFGFSAPPPFANKVEMDAFLHRAIKHRLLAIREVLPVWPQAMGLLALPPNVPGAIGLEAQLVDEIWAQAGDRSVDVGQTATFITS